MKLSFRKCHLLVNQSIYIFLQTSATCKSECVRFLPLCMYFPLFRFGTIIVAAVLLFPLGSFFLCRRRRRCCGLPAPFARSLSLPTWQFHNVPPKARRESNSHSPLSLWPTGSRSGALPHAATSFAGRPLAREPKTNASTESSGGAEQSSSVSSSEGRSVSVTFASFHSLSCSRSFCLVFVRCAADRENNNACGLLTTLHTATATYTTATPTGKRS